MSRRDFSPELAAALDRFDVPAARAGFVDRIVATASLPRVPARRDRRGTWKLARRVMIGTVAAGALSAAAVASGLLGAAGIRVPVLTAMLAPEPTPKPKPAIAAKPAVQVALKPVVAAPEPSAEPLIADPGPIAPRFDPGARLAAQAERRAARRAFVEANPQVVPAIKKAVAREIDFVRDNPDIRTLRRIPPSPERRAFLAERPDLQAALRERQQERRALLAENPEIVDFIRKRAAERRAARAAATEAPPAIEPSDEGNGSLPR
ncbi:MAG: hypothetical protein ACKVOP_01815 [Sphingomonadaceae bacterium]